MKGAAIPSGVRMTGMYRLTVANSDSCHSPTVLMVLVANVRNIRIANRATRKAAAEEASRVVDRMQECS